MYVPPQERASRGGEARGEGGTTARGWAWERRAAVCSPGLTRRQHTVDLADLPEALATVVFQRRPLVEMHRHWELPGLHLGHRPTEAPGVRGGG